jgi:hypothetical protein
MCIRDSTNTEVYLERQQTGQERFEPSFISRMTARVFFDAHDSFITWIPNPVRQFINKRFELPKPHPGDSFNDTEKASFDTLRAVVNLMVASFLISMGTYFKLPLSTTFVVFMVAMGTSMADRAWSRENAIYRISGVLSILGGWFFTATLAFLGSFVFTLIIGYAKSWSLVILWPTLIYALNKSHRFYKKREQSDKQEQAVMNQTQTTSIEWIRESVGNHIRSLLMEASKIYYLSIQAFIDENMVQLHESKNKSEGLMVSSQSVKSELFVTYSKLPDSRLETSHYFIQCLDYVTELASSMHKVSFPIYKHFENEHKGLTPSQKTDLKELLEQTTSYFNFFIHIEKEERFELVPDMIKKQGFLLSFIESLRFEQLKKIKDGEGKNRSNILYMEVLAETKNGLLYSINLLKSHRDFVTHCQ